MVLRSMDSLTLSSGTTTSSKWREYGGRSYRMSTDVTVRTPALFEEMFTVMFTMPLPSATYKPLSSFNASERSVVVIEPLYRTTRLRKDSSPSEEEDTLIGTL